MPFPARRSGRSERRGSGNDRPECGGSLTLSFLYLCGRHRKPSMDLTTVKTVGEVQVVAATNPQIAGHVTVSMTARKINAAHVRAMPENTCAAKTRTALTF